MLKKFTVKELVFIALMGALIFVVAFSLGAGLIAVTGTPMVGGIIVNLLTGFLFVMTALVVRKFGAITLVALIHTSLSIPTINMGPPGFYKPVIGLVLGLLIDTILFAGKYKKWAYYVGALVGFVAVVPFMLWFLNLLGLPGADKLAPLLIPLMAIYGVEALIGTGLAIFVYEKKLRHSRLVKQIKS